MPPDDVTERLAKIEGYLARIAESMEKNSAAGAVPPPLPRRPTPGPASAPVRPMAVPGVAQPLRSAPSPVSRPTVETTASPAIQPMDSSPASPPNPFVSLRVTLPSEAAEASVATPSGPEAAPIVWDSTGDASSSKKPCGEPPKRSSEAALNADHRPDVITSLLGWAGAVAMVLAAGYLIRLAYDNGYLTPAR